MVTSNSNSMAERFAYNGKENNPELGLEWYDFGARNYDASLGRWMNIDPLAESFYDHTPYKAMLNNPLSYIDPDGKFTVKINGEESEAAFNELQKTVGDQITLSRADDGTVTYKQETEGPLTEDALDLMEAIDSKDVVVNLNAEDTGETEAVGVFLGNETDENGVVQTQQLVDPNKTKIIDDTSGNFGETVLHEAIESYIGGKEALARGVKSVGKATQADSNNPNSIYRTAHNSAPEPLGQVIRGANYLYTLKQPTEHQKKNKQNGDQVFITKIKE